MLVDPIVRDFDTDLWLTGWMVSMVLAVQYLTGWCSIRLLIWIQSPEMNIVDAQSVPSGLDVLMSSRDVLE